MDSTNSPQPITLAEVRAELVEIELRLEEMRKRLPLESDDTLGSLSLRQRLAFMAEDVDAAITIIDRTVDAAPNR